MALYTPYRSTGAGPSSAAASATSEFDILKNSHKFLREDEDVDERRLSWEDRLAKKFYSSLYREYAVCDLKHYKSGNFALRWRTEEEVLSGAGETTCGNTRCPLHREFPGGEDDNVRPALTVLELPFSYTERGESKFALVKVVLCAKCCKKLMWKRNKEKKEQNKQEEEELAKEGSHEAAENDGGEERRRRRRRSYSSSDEDRDPGEQARKRRVSDDDARERSRRRSSRSRSPHRRKEGRSRRSP
ncbi:folate-sensitive fragile site protein Fra10Ac1-domain-containing protein [Dichomitus squalens]|uniref:Folate-sensitive fragile site protein Fra10Ac1-domain-containing protein n=1 Tax=Dichomitus squalens TaxID=114155 RepID=A0A4Q9PDN3_9APHY|nr:folate-sensitive fragile site protein Fra10Ac1-domain-containing protein [Dichomitus squalens]TBU62869.1 folate-sensitive fragile site protein Fra10Ac1-domain-containing protein [Dichomitus squalens]